MEMMQTRETLERHTDRPLTEREQEMVLANQRLAWKIAARMYSGQIRRLGSIEDVKQLSMIALAEAVQRFKPEMGFCFSTFATPHIQFRLMTYSKSASMIRVPIQYHYGNSDKKNYKSAERARKVRSMQEFGRNTHQGERPLDFPDRRQASPEASASHKESLRFVPHLLLQLSPRQREVIDRRFGLTTGEKETRHAIGERLGVSHERVRQIECSAKERMRNAAQALQIEL
jgi:RNA polymerase nonessential primary-like sigma factor